MNRSSKYVPLFIIIALLIFVFLAIVFKNISTNSIRSYDILGLNKIKPNTNDTHISQHEIPETNMPEQSDVSNVYDQNNPISDDSLETSFDDFIDTAEQVTESEDEYFTDNSESDTDTAEEIITEPIVATDAESEIESETETQLEPETELEVESEVEDTVEDTIAGETKQQADEHVIDNLQKKTNDVIEIGKTYTRKIREKSDKVDFYTTDSECDYRIIIKTKVNDSPIYGEVKLILYDDRGITVNESRSFSPAYGNTSNYCDGFYCDFNIEKSKKHSIKITNPNSESGGDYQICIISIDRDAGANKETAKAISVGEEVTAVLNSLISDWFVCNISETGQYKFILHNIDTGCYIDVKASYENSELFTMYHTENETSNSRDFDIHREGNVFINVIPESNILPQGTYIMSVIKN